MKHTAEWRMGDTAQQRWAVELTSKGRCVLPAYAFEDVARETKVPVMRVPGGVLVTPDVLALSATRGASWHEVKSKSKSSWRRVRPGPRWEHGFDYSLLREYQDVQRHSGVPVFIVVFEIESPANDSVGSCLVPSGVWLTAPLGDVLAKGDRREDWPGGKADPTRRGRHGEGGWLWDRRIMRAWSSSGPVLPLEASGQTAPPGGFAR